MKEEPWNKRPCTIVLFENFHQKFFDSSVFLQEIQCALNHASDSIVKYLRQQKWIGERNEANNYGLCAAQVPQYQRHYGKCGKSCGGSDYGAHDKVQVV
jgi:hypothetical protein